eukprot:SAG11_NODE_3797_length_2220_cov_3.224422_3_plen_109_part_00
MPCEARVAARTTTPAVDALWVRCQVMKWAKNKVMESPTEVPTPHLHISGVPRAVKLPRLEKAVAADCAAALSSDLWQCADGKKVGAGILIPFSFSWAALRTPVALAFA